MTDHALLGHPASGTPHRREPRAMTDRAALGHSPARPVTGPDHPPSTPLAPPAPSAPGGALRAARAPADAHLAAAA
ncbi:hypothetical protein SMCF_5731, partial [Streptomyces coelicoflavus ZG0656]